LRFEGEDHASFALRLQTAHQHRLIHEVRAARDVRTDMLDISELSGLKIIQASSLLFLDPPKDHVDSIVDRIGHNVINKITQVTIYTTIDLTTLGSLSIHKYR
jgi:hypothetical protein